VYVKVGTYTGNGSSQSITGLGFTPKFVLVKALANLTDVFRIDTMPAGDSKQQGTAALVSTGITAFGSDGFTVGALANANQNGTTFYYIAIGGPGVWTTSYVGTGASLSITGAGFAPDAVITVGTATGASVLKTAAMGTLGYALTGTVINSSAFTSLDADGFTVGNHSSTGTNGNTYYAVAMEEGAGFDVSSYTGTGSALSVTGVGFQPDATLVKKHATNFSYMRTSFHTTTLASYIGGGLSTISTGITALNADGYSIGTSVDVNQNTVVASALSFSDNAPAAIELAGVATLAIDAAAAMSPLRALLGAAELSVDGAGALDIPIRPLAGVAEVVITGSPVALLSGALQELAGVAELSIDSAAVMNPLRALVGDAAELSIDALSAELESLILQELAGVAELVVTGAGALSIPFRSLFGVAEVAIDATSRVYNPDAEGGSENGEEPGGGLAVSRFPQHWRALRVGDIMNAITPNAGVGGTSPVLRLLELTAETGATDADCTWQYYEETTEPTLSRNLGAAKPFARERLPRALAEALRTTNQADGRRRG
jgi:hypothetical protein